MHGFSNKLRESFLSLFGTRLGAQFIHKVIQPLDHRLYRWSAGRLLFLNGVLPTLMLTTIGAKSGQPRKVPLIYLRDGQRIVLLASNYARPQHPAWYLNLRANPGCRVEFGGRGGDYSAREAEGGEREELWRRAVIFYPGYQAYQARTEGRRIPVIVLEPTA